MRSIGAHDTISPVAQGEERLDVRRRRQLIEAAITCIAEHGLSGTTVVKVSQAAGLSPGIVNFYFQSKDALLLATLRYVAEEFERYRLEAVARASGDPVRQLEAVIDNNFAPGVCNPRWVAVWLAFWGEARARADYLRVCGNRDAAYMRQTVALFERIAQEGGYRELDAKALGTAFTHMLNSLPEELLDEANPWDREQAKQTCRRFLASVFPAEFSAPRAPEAEGLGAHLCTPTAEIAPQPETLATWMYHHPEFHELEKEYVFRRHWLLVGHVSEVAKPGDYLTLDAADERALIIRGRDGALRAFHNVCLHRASRLLSGDRGHCRGGIVCPYHGWSYGFDGALRSVPSESRFPTLDKSRARLGELELDDWMGFLFVRLGGSGPSAHEILGIFDDEVAPHCLPELKPCGPRSTFELDVNWKIAVENDIEGYHIPTGHPGLRRLFGERVRDEHWESGASRASLTLRDAPSPAWSERLYQKLLSELAHPPQAARHSWTYYGLFPRAVINLTPDLVYWYRYLPLGPEKCRMVGQALALDDERRGMRAARYVHQRINRRVVAEDMALCRAVDAGVRSSGYRGGHLSDLESGVRAHQARIRALIPVSWLDAAPAAGTLAALNAEMMARGVREAGAAGCLGSGSAEAPDLAR
jgi:phenylpropionate dioxygenase-like ring-hydroxylating dioxygenase large terminal subunit/AcrR family transcriptional regulator